MVTHVQRVEVLDGPWRRGDCILLHTGRGVLALEAPDAAMHATWMLGLNAALFSTQTRGKEVLLEAPVRAIPRIHVCRHPAVTGVTSAVRRL